MLIYPFRVLVDKCSTFESDYININKFGAIFVFNCITNYINVNSFLPENIRVLVLSKCTLFQIAAISILHRQLVLALSYFIFLYLDNGAIIFLQ